MKAKVLSIITATTLLIGGQSYLAKTVLIANAASNARRTPRFNHQPTPQPKMMVNAQSASNTSEGQRPDMPKPPKPLAQPHYRPVRLGQININNRDWRPNMSDDSYIMNSNLDQKNSTSTSSASSDPDSTSKLINPQVKRYTDQSNDQTTSKSSMKQFFSATPTFSYTKFVG